MAEDSKETVDEKVNAEQDQKAEAKGAEEQEVKDEEKTSGDTTEPDADSKGAENKPQDPDADHADMEAKLDGLTKQNASILDMLTSILNAISPSTTDTPEPDNSDKAQKGDTLQDFENLLN